jgi:Cys-tRNA(Pro)/Cys-tRNA(Cys) deacylase
MRRAPFKGALTFLTLACQIFRIMAKDKTNAMRALDAHKIPYQVFTFPPEVHSATGVAESVGLAYEQVYKTLVVLRPVGKPMLIMIAGQRELDLKQVANEVGEKKVRMASYHEAEQLTGLKVGGISALALLNRPFDVFIDREASQLSHILVSAGKRGVNLQLSVKDLMRITRARVIDASRPPDEHS